MRDEITLDFEAIRPRPIVFVSIGEKRFHLTMEDNSSAAAFLEKLSEEGRITIDMRDYGNFEKVGELPWKLETNDARITARPGDLILCQGDKITIYYGENTWSLTRLGRLYVPSEDELREALGDGDVIAEFFVEWTE